jgi:hypothetical protein
LAREDNGALKARDLLLVDSVDIGKDGVLPGRLDSVSWVAYIPWLVLQTYDLLGNVDFLENGHRALLQRAFDINLR